MRFRLKLDHDGVYFGSEALLEGEEVALGADDVVLDHAPDNAPGLYRWSRKEARLEALPKAQQKAAPGAPTLEQAMHEFFTLGFAGPKAKAWCEWFEKSIDNRG